MVFTDISTTRCVLAISFLRPSVLTTFTFFNDTSRTLIPNEVWAVSSCRSRLIFSCLFSCAGRICCDNLIKLCFTMCAKFTRCHQGSLGCWPVISPDLSGFGGESTNQGQYLTFASNRLWGKSPTQQFSFWLSEPGNSRFDASLPHKCGVPKLAGTPHLCGSAPKMRIAVPDPRGPLISCAREC